jgi:hypothetical protein
MALPSRPVLPAGIARIRRKLAGAEDDDRQKVSDLGAVLHDDLPDVEAADNQAMREGVCSADVIIIKILSRQREPTALLTVLTTTAEPAFVAETGRPRVKLRNDMG